MGATDAGLSLEYNEVSTESGSDRVPSRSKVACCTQTRSLPLLVLTSLRNYRLPCAIFIASGN